MPASLRDSTSGKALSQGPIDGAPEANAGLRVDELVQNGCPYGASPNSTWAWHAGDDTSELSVRVRQPANRQPHGSGDAIGATGVSTAIAAITIDNHLRED